jgi:large subunit ribosomal protein L32
MAVPFRRVSKTRKRMRRTHFKLDVTGLTTCPNCGALIRSHQVCPKCGYYKGENVLNPEKEKETTNKKTRKTNNTKKTTKNTNDTKAKPTKKAPEKAKVQTKQKTGE